MKTLKLLAVVSLVVVATGCGPTPAPPPDSTSDSSTKSQEAALAEGSVQLTDRVSYILQDGERQHEEFPDSFWVPPAEQRSSLQKDQIVKLMFQITANGETQTERMWVVVEKQEADAYVGLLDNDPHCTDEMKAGLQIHFQPRHVIQIFGDDDSQ